MMTKTVFAEADSSKFYADNQRLFVTIIAQFSVAHVESKVEAESRNVT